MSLPLFHMIDGAPDPVAPFSHAVEADGWVFVTGQMPFAGLANDSDYPEGIEAQTHQVMKNLSTVLQGVGLDLDNVVQVRVYLLDFDQHYGQMNAAYASWFPAGKRPARTCIGVTGLARGALVEIDMVARRPVSAPGGPERHPAAGSAAANRVSGDDAIRTKAGDDARDATPPRLPFHDAQIPPPGQLNLDHVAHFVPDRDAAAAALQRLGFTLTPFSEQSHRTEPGGPVVPAGTGNRCVMMREGYLEFLTPFLDTPIAEQLRVAIRRYTGVHLIAYGTPDADADFARLEARGFQPLTPVRLQREAQTAGGATTVRFTVTRTAPGTMPEGRIQFCGHQTPEGVWQLRWVNHPNRAAGLRRVFVCVEDPVAAATRYASYTGIPTAAASTGPGVEYVQQTARGSLHLMDAAALHAQFELSPPSLPWIAGYELLSEDLSVTRSVLEQAGAPLHPLADGRLRVLLPPELGGFIVFSAQA